MWRGLLASCLLALVFTAGGAGAETAQAAGSPGAWSTAAGPTTGREEHTATLLHNGSVLIAGGTDGRNNPLASAEIYSQTANRWAPAGSMTTARLDHTATLLQNGKVLVVGGFAAPVPSSSLASAEIYDPATNTWSSAAPMSAPRARHTSALLADGRVLVVGGDSFDLRSNGLFLIQPTDAEIYDPKSNRWSATAPMNVYRLDHTATLLKDGRVLVVGGQDGLTSTELYDAARDRWTEGASMGTGRLGHVAVLLADGDVLVAGGLGTEPSALSIALKEVEIYHARLSSWQPRASTAEVHSGETATLLGNGMVLVVGTTGNSRPELYDPARNQWSRTGPPMDRYRHTATRLADGRVLIVGGYGLDSLKSVLVYDPTAAVPRPWKPVDWQVIVLAVLAAALLIAGIPLSVPGVRRRLKRWRRHRHDDWIT